MTINLEGNLVIVGCIECGRFEVFDSWDTLLAEGWHDDDTEHVACPDCGPAWAQGVVVGQMADGGSEYPGMSYEEGVDEALRWVLGENDNDEWPFGEEV